MLRAIFTLDYEIHGNGEGSPYDLMIEPTERMLRLFGNYGAKLTIMADIGEILKFKEYAEEKKRDDYHYSGIVSQLQDAVAHGHDVQLHIHSSYFKATCDGRRWSQHWPEYDFANLSLDRMTEMIRLGKGFLESILRPVNPGYRCIAFRAASWSVNPARNVVKALTNNGIEIDTSVFKYGRRDGIIKFDYTGAYSNVIPWRASKDDLRVRDDRGPLWEFPIYSENRRMGAFLTANRIYRVAQNALHPKARPPAENDGAVGASSSARRPGLADRMCGLAKRHAWKADFNQCTGRQLIGALHRAEHETSGVSGDLPFVLIGHSKIFTRWNERSLRPFLEHVADHPQRFGFGTFDSFVKPEHASVGREMATAASEVL